MDEFQCIESFLKKWIPINPLLSNRFFVGVGDDASVFKLDKNFPLWLQRICWQKVSFFIRN